MPNPKTDEKSTSLDRDEHISKGAIGAKRVALYTYDSNTDTLSPLAPALTPNVDFDYIDIQQTSATVETYVFKTGGSGGTTVQTIVVTYTSSAKTDLDKVEYS